MAIVLQEVEGDIGRSLLFAYFDQSLPAFLHGNRALHEFLISRLDCLFFFGGVFGLSLIFVCGLEVAFPLGDIVDGLFIIFYSDGG